ncbi:hypothetical protein BN7_45 [Wickerhamomyces ciferrii]|uniref:Uncharacterized protein n=1 Tax=Wickerhamomyces ciferrii (strain ATCC 14091 / BCRC 22168 / CBS 111 / JCM 3599 / NBRC 0793 / NRRL Y-1031 F-60-10) TaxID=1206466 RepID=K0KE43_WICCF|nr:uncharacterized protein BN7_45 [Wickerhamomyces ciferrii]CCH40512.1 hypothetical protein BN7_45 [Wickerhamomyces ciferrii]
MSGIFDKYLNMINGSKHTHGQMNTKTNAGLQSYYMNSKEHSLPKRRASSMSSMDGEEERRSSSVSSQGGLDGGNMNSSNNPFQNPGLVENEQVKKVLMEPNNRVNF